MMNKMKYRLTVLKMLLPQTAGVKRFFTLSFILSVITMLTGFITPLFYKLFIDEVILNGRFNKMPVVAAGYLGIFFAGVLFGYLKNYANYTLVNTVLYRTKHKIWRGFFRLPFADYETAAVGDMKMRLDDDTAQISSFAGTQTIDYFIAAMTAAGSLTLLFIIDWRLALFSVAAIPLTFWLDHALSKREKVLNNTNRENDQRMSGWLQASIQSWREIKALGLEHAQERRFIRYLHNFALFFGLWINYWTARALVIPKIKDEFIMRFGLYFIGGLLIISGNLKISDLLIFTMYYAMLSDAVKTVSAADAELQSNMPFTDRLLEELNRFEDLTTQNGISPDGSDTILFENVCFSYPKTNAGVLYNFNLKILKGERIAITGKSGCGKTTVLKLMTGMIAPTSGRVSFGGVDLSEIDLAALHGRIGFVMQENMLFNLSIRENLLYGNENASDSELRSACEKAYILDFIESLPQGFDTMIGEKGIKLSGGQRQRIVLARLFLRDAEVFIFDEATSALDVYSENIIHDAIRSIAKDKTVIVVAHRQSSLALCDRHVLI